jgi:hypothetical protein
MRGAGQRTKIETCKELRRLWGPYLTATRHALSTSRSSMPVSAQPWCTSKAADTTGQLHNPGHKPGFSYALPLSLYYV